MMRVALFGFFGALLGGGLGVMIAAAPDEGEIFITSDQPITLAQVHDTVASCLSSRDSSAIQGCILLGIRADFSEW